MAANNPLHQAKRQKKDEFYTQLPDIEKELRHYADHFRDKVVFCNCDDPRASNFFTYFQLKFRVLGLRKLITTCYQNQNPDMFSRHVHERSIGLEITEKGGDTGDLPSFDIFNLEGDGDFRSNESIELLNQADIVVTNPPFSLFREYVDQLMEYGKQFLILADQNAISYKEIFPLIKDNRLWLGYDNGGTKWFRVPMEYDIKTESRKKIENDVKYFSMGRIMWFTNLDHAKRHEDLILYRRYSKDEYPKYDNYDAINVDKTSDIPVDYPGAIGVPITFLAKHNPDQFEIIGMDRPLMTELTGKVSRFLLNGKEKYARVVIRNKRL